MKPFLVNVPVKTNIWIRKECQRKQFEILRKVRPSILFVISDGGRNDKEWGIIKENRKMFDDEIDWDCKVFKLYESTNCGMYSMIEKMHALIWDKVDRCIFMEDDILPSESFFKFCEEMFSKYEHDQRIYAICGMNHLGLYNDCPYDYFFSRYGSVWGIGLWKRSYQEYNNLSFCNDSYSLNNLKEITRTHKTHQKQIESIARNNKYDGHKPGDEFFINLSNYGHHQLLIIPKVNMISNIGCTRDATHGDDLWKMPRGLRRVFNMKTYDVSFPLECPQYVMPDIQYEKKRNRIMALDYPLIACYRKIERTLHVMRNGDLAYVWRKILNRIQKHEK